MKNPLPIIRDTREQDGFTFQSCLRPGDTVTVGTLHTGDYSIAGFQNRVCVERKNPNDLVGSLTEGRDRFEGELGRMLLMDAALVVVEAPAAYFLAGHHRGATRGESIVQSCLAFSQRYRVEFALCADREAAERRAYDFLRHYARDRSLGRPSFHERILFRDWQETEKATVK